MIINFRFKNTLLLSTLMLFFVLTSVNAQAGSCAIFEGSWTQYNMSENVKFEQFDIQDTQQQGVFSYSAKFANGENTSDKGAVDCENFGNNNYKLTFHFPHFTSVNKVQLSNDYLNWSGSWGNEQSNGKSNFSRITPPPQLIEKNNKTSSNTTGSNTTGSNTDGRSTAPSQSSSNSTLAGNSKASRTNNSSGGKKTYLHDSLAEAHNCIQPEFRSLYGGFINSCDQKVTYGYCIYKPKKGGWTDATFFDCEQDMALKPPGMGGQTVKAFGKDANHTRGGEKVFWFGCKNGANAEELHFNGEQITGKCIHRWD